MKFKLFIAALFMASMGFCAQAQTCCPQTQPQDSAVVLKAPVKTGNNVADIKAVFNYVKAKFLACESIADVAALENDKVFMTLEKDMEKMLSELTPEQQAEISEWLEKPENNVEAVIAAKMQQLMPDDAKE